MCNVRRCDQPVHAKGMCQPHYRRSRRGQYLPATIRKRGVYFGEADYSAAHRRCRYMWGSASRYPCVQCGSPAHVWAYDGTDPTAALGWNSTSVAHQKAYPPSYYSFYPEFYMPLCHSHHNAHDIAFRSRELMEYRMWKMHHPGEILV